MITLGILGPFNIELVSFPGGGVLDLNLYGDVPRKKNFHRAPEFLPSNDTLF